MPPRSRSASSAKSATTTKPKPKASSTSKKASARSTSLAIGDMEDLVHGFSNAEVAVMQANLLAWFDANKRDLPWRRGQQAGGAGEGMAAPALVGAVGAAAESAVRVPSAEGKESEAIAADSDRQEQHPCPPSPPVAEPSAESQHPPADALSPSLPPPSSPVVTRKRPARAAAQRGAAKRAKLSASMWLDMSGSSASEDKDDGDLSSELSDVMNDDDSSADDDDDDDDDLDNLSSPPTTPAAVSRGAALSALANASVFPAHVDRDAPGQHAYEVWISEIMCQQTQVGTATPYYIKWMAKWPTVFDLARASIEEVNQTWAGLGYYSRAHRLHTSARLLVSDYAGILPSTPAALERIPGIGKYTAGAIASIAYARPAPVVDGNVIRVLSRVRALGGDPKTKSVGELHWALAGQLVGGCARPGDCNEAVMELGARVCTPTSPACGACPLREQCWAQRGERRRCACTHCQTWTGEEDEEQEEDGPVDVTIYPRKPAKKPMRHETVYAAVVQDTARSTFCIVQRPAQGLLANMWEFVCDKDANVVEAMVQTVVDAVHGGPIQRRKKVGSVKHLFSHIKMTLEVEYVAIAGGTAPGEEEGPAGDRADARLARALGKRAIKWVSEDDMHGEAVSTGMKKVFQLVKQKVKGLSGDGGNENGDEAGDDEGHGKVTKKVAKGKGKGAKPDPKQPSIASFFKKD